MSRRFAVRTIATIAAALAVVGTALVPSIATADVIPNAITSIQLTSSPGPFPSNTNLAFEGTWAVPNLSNPGDTFTMQLPPELGWRGPTTFDLPNANGTVVATASVSPSGLATFTLTNEVLFEPFNVHGTFDFITRYTNANAAAGPRTLTFKDAGGTTISTVNFQEASPCPTTCVGIVPGDVPKPYKIMRWTDATETRIDIQLGGGTKTVDNATVTLTDDPPANIRLDCSSVSQASSKFVNDSGAAGDPFESPARTPSFNCSPSHLDITFTNVPAHTNFIIDLKANVVDVGGVHLSSYPNSGTFVVNTTSTPISRTLDSEIATGTGTGETGPGAFTVVKTDAATGARLAGATFEYTGISIITPMRTIGPTNASGQVNVGGLEPGTYMVRELTAPAGYLVNPTQFTVTVQSRQITTLTVTDVADPAQVPVPPTPPTPPTIAAPPAPLAGGASTPSEASGLASTGADPGVAPLVGMLAVLLGAVIVVFGRRRHHGTPGA